jgi:predicted nucleic acid-binding protein
MRVLIDTNILISALLRDGLPENQLGLLLHRQYRPDEYTGGSG